MIVFLSKTKNFILIQIKSPGRICFFGDHQDYLGLPVIAGTIDRYIYLKASRIKYDFFEINLLDYDKSIKVEFKNDPKKISSSDYFRAGLCVLEKNGIVPDKGYKIDINGDLPINAGLSSSSSLVVAWIRFLVQEFAHDKNIDNLQIAKWAVQTEVDFFKQAGGIMDQYTIALGGLILIDTLNKTYKNLQGNLGPLLVINSGEPKNTQGVLSNARENAQKALNCVKKINPNFVLINSKINDYEKYKNQIPINLQPYWESTILNYQITKSAINHLNLHNPPRIKLGELMNSHQFLLENNIRNTPIKLKKQMKQALKSGATGAKIVGSGGGGCMVVMLEEKEIIQVKKSILDAGAKDVFEVNITN
tara:strand:+ start:1552 stop:2640 length:1089 start_codon:yes stop_codon:yes gene_type:complete